MTILVMVTIVMAKKVRLIKLSERFQRSKTSGWSSVSLIMWILNFSASFVTLLCCFVDKLNISKRENLWLCQMAVCGGRQSLTGGCKRQRCALHAITTMQLCSYALHHHHHHKWHYTTMHWVQCTPHNHHYATMNSIPPPLCIQYAIRPPTYNYAPTMIYTKTMLWAMPPLSTMQCNHARLHPQSSIYLAFCPPPLCSMRSPSRLVQ